MRRATVSCQELEVTIIRADGLRALDIGGTSDPYVKLFCGQERFGKSSYCERTLAPVWNERFVLSVPSQHKIGPLDYIIIEVWDKDSISTDDLIGAARVFFPRTHDPQTSWHKQFQISGNGTFWH